MKKSILSVLSFMLCAHVIAQAPAIQWQKSLGGTNDDYANAMQQTTDGGYIIAGGTSSNDGDVTLNRGGIDYWIVKINDTGAIQWQKSYGGSQDDEAYSIMQTSDGGYIVAGTSYSNDGDVTGHHSTAVYRDYWIVKLNDTGGIQWQKSLGGTNDEVARSIQQTTDSGYIVAGVTSSNDGDVSGNHGVGDYWVVKLNDTGAIQWQKSLGGSNNDAAFSIHQTSGGGYIVAGMSSSNDGNVTGNHGSSDYWIVKLDDTGLIEWQKSYGGSGNDEASDIRQTVDGGYIVAGSSWSTDGNITGNHGSADAWIVKLSDTGAIQWQKSFGGSSEDYGYSVSQTVDGGYIVSGSAGSGDGDISGGIHGGSYADYWVIKLNDTGSLQWQKVLGGTSLDQVDVIQQTSDGGYFVSGWSMSNDGDITGNHGYTDYWVVKLGCSPCGTLGVSNISTTPGTGLFPNPTSGNIFVSGLNNANIRAYNLLGQLINEADNTDHISIAAFPAGMYFVKVFDSGGNLYLQGKVIKQ